MRPRVKILVCFALAGGCSADNPLFGLEASATSGGSTSAPGSVGGGQDAAGEATDTSPNGTGASGGTHNGSNDTGPNDTAPEDGGPTETGLVDTGGNETGNPTPVQQCCEPNGAMGCGENEDIQACVCDQYPDCCNNWTEACVALAAGCGGNCILDCCIPSPQGGCDDGRVEQCVCSQDAECCDAWDPLCVTLADVSCGGSCVADGSCCLARNTTGCNDLEVQSCVCADDPYCCITSWDAICVAFAFDCEGCEAPGEGPCCELHKSPGCTDSLGGPAVQNCVCDTDPSCCSMEWHEDCVVAAEDCANVHGIVC